MLGAVVGVIGTLQATEVLKEILGIGETLAGRLMIYDALADALRADQGGVGPGQSAVGHRRRRSATCRSMTRGRRCGLRGLRPWRRTAAVKIRGILFDKDGTLLDYWRTWVPINREIAHVCRRRRRGGWPRSCCAPAGTIPRPTALRRARCWPPAASTRSPRFSPGVLGSARRPTWPRHIEAICSRGGAKHSVLIDGVADAGRQLKRRGLRIGVATNDSIGGLEASLAPPASSSLFDFVAGCNSGYGAKPEPGMALAFCEAVAAAA